jgi:FtsP/CotA-like multicopper oxidase with cupredoxin domain
LRLRQGEPTRIIVENRFNQVTTVHWHGVRVPNAMDGVPGLTLPPIKPGESFVYEFTPPDAGTFWYHPHANSLEQLGRGLAGPIIVEEREPPQVDRDVLWFLQDWRLTGDGEIAPGFGNPMEAAMSGRVGNTVTLNGRVSENEPARAGERVRLRLVNACAARMRPCASRAIGQSSWRSTASPASRTSRMAAGFCSALPCASMSRST